MMKGHSHRNKGNHTRSISDAITYTDGLRIGTTSMQQLPNKNLVRNSYISTLSDSVHKRN